VTGPNKKALLLLSGGHCAVDIYHGALPAMLPLLKEAFRLSYTETGLILLVFQVSSSVIQPIFGYVTDRSSQGWLMPTGVVATALGVSLAPLASRFGFLLALAFLAGMGVAAFHPEGFRNTAHFAGEAKASGIAWFSVGGNTGYAMGPLMATYVVGFLGRKGFPVMGVIGLAYAGVLVANMGWLSAPRRAAGDGGRDGREVAGATLGPFAVLLAAVLFRSWTQMGLAAFIPLYYVDQLHASYILAGNLLFVFLGAGAVGTLLGAPLADRIGHRRYFTLSLLVVVPLAALFPYSRGVWAVLLLAVAGGIIVSSFAVTIAMGQTLMPGNLGMSSGLITGLAIGLGGVAVTGLGWIADHWGLMASMHVIPVLPLAGALLTLGIRMPPIRREAPAPMAPSAPRELAKG
jgi:FSR family fosmidomycin resistance protein-like MFS transporter